MSTSSSPLLSSDRAAPRWLAAAGQIALVVLLFLSLVRVPVPPATALDVSWQMVLGYAAEHGLQHGHDLVFTYGPLGYLMTAVYGGSLWPHFLWQVGTAAISAVGLWLFGRRLPGWRQAGFYLYVCWFAAMYTDATWMVIIAVFAAALLRPRCGPLATAGVMAFLAVLSLVKFTHLMLTLALLAPLSAHWLIRHLASRAVLAIATFGGVFLAGWWLSGQSFAHLPAFLRYSFELSSGYSGAMGYDESIATLALGLLTSALAAGYLLLQWLTSTDRLRSGCLALMLGAVLFMNWKHGFTRADGHVLAHFLLVLLLPATYPALLGDERRWDRAKNLLLAALVLLALPGIQSVSGSSTSEAPAFWNDRLRATVASWSDWRGFQSRLEAITADTARAVQRPTLQQFLGNQSVDHLGDDQAISLLNGLNYRPRPVVQGYASYTPALNRLDEAFYRSPRAPAFTLQRFSSIDDRLVALDDSLTQKLIYQHYDYVMEEGGLLLWERPHGDLPNPDAATEKVVLTRSARFGERVEVPDLGDSPLWLTVRIRQNFAGRLRQFLYKPPALRIVLHERDGDVRHDRLFVRAMGETGFILEPYFASGDDLVAFQHGAAPRRIRHFSLEVAEGGAGFYGDEIGIEIRTLAPFKRASHGLQPDTPWRFRMMNRVPSHLSAGAPATAMFIDGKHLLQMHPPSVMDYAIDAPVRSLRAEFGFNPAAYAQPNGTDGAVFSVEWVHPDGRVDVLASRFLDPKRRAEDRPRQVFTIDLGGRANGTLRLRTDAPPGGSTAFGWCYWTGILLE